MNIFVARLNYDTQASDLRYAFEEFGAVNSAKVITDHYTGQSKGYGFVEMPNDGEAREAISELNDERLDGRTIVVKKANPRGSGRSNSSSSGYYQTSGGSSY